MTADPVHRVPAPTVRIESSEGPRTVPQLRATHRSLRAERVRVTHWRRLVRARMDLATAALAMPEPLGHAVGPAVPAAARAELPAALRLLDALSTGGPEGEIDRLEHLRALDARLAAYESTVAGALRDVAGELIERLVTDPVAPAVSPVRPCEAPWGTLSPGRDPRHS